MIIFNILGAVMILIAVGIAYGVGLLVGVDVEGPLTMILVGALCILFDATYRCQQPDGHWVSPFTGGNIFFIPVWVIGAIWMVVGSVQAITLRAPVEMLAGGVIGAAVVVSLGLAAIQAIPRLIAALNAAEREQTSTPSWQKEMVVFPCPECDLPVNRKEMKNGKCPWCGINVDEPKPAKRKRFDDSNEYQ